MPTITCLPVGRSVASLLAAATLTLSVGSATNRAAPRVPPQQMSGAAAPLADAHPPLAELPRMRSLVEGVTLSAPRLKILAGTNVATGQPVSIHLMSVTVRNEMRSPVQVVIFESGETGWGFGDASDSKAVIEPFSSVDLDLTLDDLKSTDVVELRAVIYQDGAWAGSKKTVREYYYEKAHARPVPPVPPGGGAE